MNTKLGRKTRLSTKVIEEVAELVRKRSKVQTICDIIGISYGTFNKWRKRGRQETEGIYHELVKAIDQAESDLFEELSQVVFNAALTGSKEYRKITKTIQDPKGQVRTEETETHIETAANANLALKLLERKYPNKWGAVQRISVNWQDMATSQGVDPEQLQSEFKQLFVLADVVNDTEDQKALPSGDDDGSDN